MWFPNTIQPYRERDGRGSMSEQKPPAALRLTDRQLAMIMEAGRGLEPEKRGLFLERTAAALRAGGYLLVKDGDVERAIRTALRGLLHVRAAV